MKRRYGNSRIQSILGKCFLLAFLVWTAGPAIIGVQASELTFNLRFENGRVPENMRLVRVQQGDVVTLRWSVDQPVILHLHGYDIERRIEPGTVGEFTFTAGVTGRFPVHVHTTATRIGSLAHKEAPIVYIEVYPR